MNEDTVNIEVDGKRIAARKGAMLIEATDAAGITIPRFCYHQKLSVAANCRMCLVEVEKAPKPLPACATPVADGMKVSTRSPLALQAQGGTMEFLLINHPLDCPICDQGGECELQDVAMGFGNSISRYTEAKRVVVDKDLGPLVSTDMTRCIHCTRCVRFGQEIAGLPELGTIGRGETMRIDTFVERGVSSELSGNMIDVCPVGALTAKPSRFAARAWELVQKPSIAVHDCMGANIYLHTHADKVVRTVPRTNEQINECWLSDRDRFSYQGLYSSERLITPKIKRDAQWFEVSWEEALSEAAKALQKTCAQFGPKAIGALVGPSSSLEEMYLCQQLMRGLGSHNIDHRLRQVDFEDQQFAPIMPWLGQGFDALEQLDAALLIGSNVRKEQPLAALRLRKASLNGAKISLLNARAYDYHFELHQQLVRAPLAMVACLAAVTKAAFELAQQALPPAVAAMLKPADVSAEHRAVALSLYQADKAAIILGSQAVTHPHWSRLRALASVLSEVTGCTFGYLPESSHSAGAWLAGCVPHREAAGVASAAEGLHTVDMLGSCNSFLLLNVEPARDLSDARRATAALAGADAAVVLSAFTDADLQQSATVLLPIATVAESSGTSVNAVGAWQTYRAAVVPPGEARPAWKVLRMLAEQLQLSALAFNDLSQLQSELRATLADVRLSNALTLNKLSAINASANDMYRFGDSPTYGGDALVRRAHALQATAEAQQTAILLAPQDVERLNLRPGFPVVVTQDDASVSLEWESSEQIPNGCVWISVDTLGLGSHCGTVQLRPA